ncbi:uncharacterized protein V1513DRAFT_441210 [Lipomyces chichibuensis]|uniref:uncharacterized protein n=1 Tax=Lipomyces chichibuensis TaxID=1546026 RepID=UPI003343E7F4
MRLESHWRILKKDYASRFVKPRLDLLAYIICTRLVRPRNSLVFTSRGMARETQRAQRLR